MALALVTNQLQQLASACAAKAVRANDPDTIAALHKAEEQFRRLQAMVQANMTELEGYRAVAAAKAAKASQKGRIGALEFWRRHGLAVDAIRAVYGDNWKIKAPYGETEIVSVPDGWRSCTTDRGTKLKWPRDARMPAARFWTDGKLPPALIVVPDYPRSTGRAKDEVRDDAWHLAHGYVDRGGKIGWTCEMLVRGERDRVYHIELEHARVRQVASDRAAARAAAEDAEVDSEMPLAEAAD